MADARITDLSALTGVNVVGGDIVPVVDVSDTTDNAAGSGKKITVDELIIALQARGTNRIKSLGSQHSVSSTTPTKVTDLDMALEAGTFRFDYRLLCQAGVVTAGPLFNLNFSTGTVTKKGFWFQYADLSATLLAAIGTAAHDTTTSTLGFQMAKAEDDFATTATGNMGPTATTNDVQTINTDIMYQLTGIMTVTVAGTLELWHGSAAASASTVEVGSSLVVVRTA